jgi:hypothetical protein
VFLLALVLSALAVAAPEAPLPGRYEKPCARFEEDDFLTATLTLQPNGGWARVRTAYEEESCVTPWIEYHEEARWSRRAGEELDLTFQSAAYRPLSAEVAEALNMAAFCGVTDWREGILRKITGKECGDFRVPEKDATVYTRAANVGSKLFLGEEDATHDGASPERRHARFEAEGYEPASP